MIGCYLASFYSCTNPAKLTFKAENMNFLTTHCFWPRKNRHNSCQRRQQQQGCVELLVYQLWVRYYVNCLIHISLNPALQQYYPYFTDVFRLHFLEYNVQFAVNKSVNLDDLTSLFHSEFRQTVQKYTFL